MTEDNYPTTREAAIDRVVEALSEDQREIVQSTEFDELHKLHHGLGAWIRNCLGLWKGNAALIREFTDNPFVKPDDASALIIEAVWFSIQSNEARLDRANEAMRARAAFSTHIPVLTWEEIGDLFDREGD